MKSIEAHIEVIRRIDPAVITEATEAILGALRAGGKVLICGNGGSAAESQHLAAELVGRFMTRRRPLPALALTADGAVLTCIANDFGYEQVFARQVEALGQQGDCLVAISTSGQSPNVIAAIEQAHRMGMSTIGLTGKAEMPCDYRIAMQSTDTARIQEAHALVVHLMCEGIDAAHDE